MEHHPSLLSDSHSETQVRVCCRISCLRWATAREECAMLVTMLLLMSIMELLKVPDAARLGIWHFLPFVLIMGGVSISFLPDLGSSRMPRQSSRRVDWQQHAGSSTRPAGPPPAAGRASVSSQRAPAAEAAAAEAGPRRQLEAGYCETRIRAAGHGTVTRTGWPRSGQWGHRGPRPPGRQGPGPCQGGNWQ